LRPHIGLSLLQKLGLPLPLHPHQYGLPSSHDKSQASIFCFFIWRYVICWCDKCVTVCDRMCHILTEKPSVHGKPVVKRSGAQAQMCTGVRISWRIRVSSCFPVFVRVFAANKQTSTGYHHWVGSSDSRIKFRIQSNLPRKILEFSIFSAQKPHPV